MRADISRCRKRDLLVHLDRRPQRILDLLLLAADQAFARVGVADATREREMPQPSFLADGQDPAAVGTSEIDELAGDLRGVAARPTAWPEAASRGMTGWRLGVPRVSAIRGASAHPLNLPREIRASPSQASAALLKASQRRGTHGGQLANRCAAVKRATTSTADRPRMARQIQRHPNRWALVSWPNE